MMKHSFPRQIVPCAVCVCLFLVTLLAPALFDSSSPFETMDLGTLKAQADRLQAQVDRKAADYATLRDLALILRTIAARDRAPYGKRTGENGDEVRRSSRSDLPGSDVQSLMGANIEECLHRVPG